MGGVEVKGWREKTDLGHREVNVLRGMTCDSDVEGNGR